MRTRADDIEDILGRINACDQGTYLGNVESELMQIQQDLANLENDLLEKEKEFWKNNLSITHEYLDKVTQQINPSVNQSTNIISSKSPIKKKPSYKQMFNTIERSLDKSKKSSKTLEGLASNTDSFEIQADIIRAKLNNPNTFMEGVTLLDKFVGNRNNFDALAKHKNTIRDLNTQVIVIMAESISEMSFTGYEKLVRSVKNNNPDAEIQENIDNLAAMRDTVSQYMLDNIYSGETVDEKVWLYERWISMADYLHKNGDYQNADQIVNKLGLLKIPGTLSESKANLLIDLKEIYIPFKINQKEENVISNTKKRKESTIPPIYT